MAKSAAKTAPKPAAQAAAKPAAAKPAAVKPAAAKRAPKPAVAKPAAAKPATESTSKAAPKAAARPAAKAPVKVTKAAPEAPKEKPRKAKLVRDSFTMPEQEYAVLGQVKKECLKAGFDIKKSELLRIGVALIRQLDLATLMSVLADLPQLKTGRPKAE
ncbi:hypothetical protein C7C56_006965 [Massilia glaciei]|uniref:Uncharacterized protein n=1 Tax=Massilia glaciei TaxID=1524097 RepID=A0A2U2HPF5_9BURK|nr:hypothetical protein C7C56_006965 [Massilia glaciei]